MPTSEAQLKRWARFYKAQKAENSLSAALHKALGEFAKWLDYPPPTYEDVVH